MESTAGLSPRPIGRTRTPSQPKLREGATLTAVAKFPTRPPPQFEGHRQADDSAIRQGRRLQLSLLKGNLETERIGFDKAATLPRLANDD